MRSDVELILNTKGIPTIFVDADSCPVKEEIVEITSYFPLKFFLSLPMITM